MANKIRSAYHFEFSLEVLNHLGRGLYRSFATVVAEAVSNSWDAGATQVDITLGHDALTVEDNGSGMDEGDFQHKFLKVGYSRRDDPKIKSKRNVIGRKGIGKLAMLSISERVTILSRTKGGKVIGARIDNRDLNNEIAKDGRYPLPLVTELEKEKLFGRAKKKGTKLFFQEIKAAINSEDILRKYLATQFNFIFTLKKGDKFAITVNGKAITENDLKELNDKTQFIWLLGKSSAIDLGRFSKLIKKNYIKNTGFWFGGRLINVRGFIASVEEPKNLTMHGSKGEFRAGVNLFCNGRLRQENLLSEISSRQHTEEYLYGEVHVDALDDDQVDRFTSSREGIIKSDPLYQTFIKNLRKIQTTVLREWDPLRRAKRLAGDVDEAARRRPEFEIRLEDSKNSRERDYEKKIDGSVQDKETRKTLKENLRGLSYRNTQIYQELFILENLLREYIRLKKIKEGDFNLTVAEEKDLADSIDKVRSLRTLDEAKHALRGKIVEREDFLNYTDLKDLTLIIDLLIEGKRSGKKKHKKDLFADAIEIGPVRNPIMHTVEVTKMVTEWDKIRNMIDFVDLLNDKIDK